MMVMSLWPRFLAHPVGYSAFSHTETKHSQTSAETRASFDGAPVSKSRGFEASSLFTSLCVSLISMVSSCSAEEPHVVVSSYTVGCACASNDSKIAGRQITANTTATQRRLDMLTAL